MKSMKLQIDERLLKFGQEELKGITENAKIIHKLQNIALSYINHVSSEIETMNELTEKQKILAEVIVLQFLNKAMESALDEVKDLES